MACWNNGTEDFGLQMSDFPARWVENAAPEKRRLLGVHVFVTASLKIVYAHENGMRNIDCECRS